MKSSETLARANSLGLLANAGQSPWYDNIDRRLLLNGELREIFSRGMLGATSNPTIFEKAVNGSTAYDADIKKLKKEGKSALAIYDELTADDIRSACELLRDTYVKTGHLDGYVSIEVPPDLAHDAGETAASAKKILAKINKPNVMIKVPATREGIKAVREMTGDGINVNVTLIFSMEQYRQSAEAYIEGLRSRLGAGKSVKGIRSVASVFVSRIDTRIDELLEEKGKKGLQGKTAVSHMKMIYAEFKKLFTDPKFALLKEKGACPQRPLWASTSTKNPLYRDVKYVEELIGPDTVNTMPPSTMEAFLDHGAVAPAIEKEQDMARKHLAEIAGLGIDLEKECRDIQAAGVKAFQDSFDKLLSSISSK